MFYIFLRKGWGGLKICIISIFKKNVCSFDLKRHSTFRERKKQGVNVCTFDKKHCHVLTIKNIKMGAPFSPPVVIGSYLWPGVPALARCSVASVAAIVSGSAHWSWGAYFSSVSLKIKFFGLIPHKQINLGRLFLLGLS